MLALYVLDPFAQMAYAELVSLAMELGGISITWDPLLEEGEGVFVFPSVAYTK